MTTSSNDILTSYELHLLTAKYSPATIGARLELLRRLVLWLGDEKSLLTADAVDLALFQQSFSHLASASVDIYSRHVRALYRWLIESDQIVADPTRRMVKVRKPKGIPHPIADDDLRKLIACATGGLRTAYVLAAFAGLRCGEICRLRVQDVRVRAGTQVTALIQGKGNRERIVPLLPPVADELTALGRKRGPFVLTRSGKPYEPHVLSVESSMFLRSLGVESSLHSCRHYFASQVVRQTKDVLLVRDLLGHSSLQTTQIYMQSSVDDADQRLAGLSSTAALLLG